MSTRDQCITLPSFAQSRRSDGLGGERVHWEISEETLASTTNSGVVFIRRCTTILQMSLSSCQGFIAYVKENLPTWVFSLVNTGFCVFTSLCERNGYRFLWNCIMVEVFIERGYFKGDKKQQLVFFLPFFESFRNDDKIANWSETEWRRSVCEKKKKGMKSYNDVHLWFYMLSSPFFWFRFEVIKSFSYFPATHPHTHPWVSARTIVLGQWEVVSCLHFFLVVLVGDY